MSKGMMAAIGCSTVGLLGIIICVVYVVGTLNQEARVRVTITAKIKDNESEFDNMWKKIAQIAQVPEAKKNALKDIFVSHADARGKGQGGGAMMLWVKESVPNADLKVYDKLMNIINSSRDAWTMRQKELIDLKRAHDQMFETIPSSFIVSSRESLRPEITVITSTKSKEAMATGKDDDVDLFGKTKE